MFTFFKYTYRVLYLGLIGIVIFFFIKMIAMVRPYFPYTYAKDFLSTKSNQLLHNTFYLVAFYTHITTSFIALGTGIFQFIPQFIKKYKKAHRIIGQFYVYSILLLACPSGFILAIHANGGLSAQVGFSVQCIVWFMLTFLAIQKAVQHKWVAHIQLMMLSYAITLAAFSLRTESYFFYYFFNANRIDTYQTVTWLSWTGNLLIGLLLIYLHVDNYLYKQLKQ